MKKDWLQFFGWALTLGLFISIFAGYYIFNPFVFGLTYYIIYVFYKTNEKSAQKYPKQVMQRLVSISFIAILYLWLSLMHSHDKDKFINSFEKSCYSERIKTDAETRLCESIQAHVDTFIGNQR